MNNLIKLNPAAALTAAATALGAKSASLSIPDKQLITHPSLSTLARPLEDLFGRHHNYLRVSLTERCNLRCKTHLTKSRILNVIIK